MHPLITHHKPCRTDLHTPWGQRRAQPHSEAQGCWLKNYRLSFLSQESCGLSVAETPLAWWGKWSQNMMPGEWHLCPGSLELPRANAHWIVSSLSWRSGPALQGRKRLLEGPRNSSKFATRFVYEGSLTQDLAAEEQKESHLWGDMNILGLLSVYWRWPYRGSDVCPIKNRQKEMDTDGKVKGKMWQWGLFLQRSWRTT